MRKFYLLQPEETNHVKLLNLRENILQGYWKKKFLGPRKSWPPVHPLINLLQCKHHWPKNSTNFFFKWNTDQQFQGKKLKWTCTTPSCLTVLNSTHQGLQVTQIKPYLAWLLQFLRHPQETGSTDSMKLSQDQRISEPFSKTTHGAQ